ncbi:MAG TPA: HlyD family efflux transporter periplasmic adaptor subunit [Rhodoblastus sp.]|nr:HlyD family efflux transporter periplasmic adaptor subunit [Rhodoblastus sp.]
MNRKWLLAGALVLAGLGGAGALALKPDKPAPAPKPAPAYEAAAPGLVEPFGEERDIASQVIGVIGQMLVEENDVVRANQPIAIVENSEQTARLAEGKAQLAEAQAELDKAINGARPEERREAEENVAQLDADLKMAGLEFERKQALLKHGDASQAAFDQSSATLRALKARRGAAAERLALIVAGTRKEDIEIARARVARLQADTDLAAALLDKTIIRSPIDGVILRRQRNAGEAVTNMDPTHIAIVGDVSRLRLRAEVDETDIGHIRVGQRIEAKADAFPGKSFGGTVARIAERLGSKRISTGLPSEKIDMKVLQVLIDLDPDVKLPVGLRMDVYFLAPGAAPHVAAGS